MQNEHQALLRLKEISMIFTKKTGLFKQAQNIGAVVDVNLDIYPGEVVAVVGESGCGKTTLGNVVTGLLQPTKGTVEFEGRRIWKSGKSDFEKYRRGVQLVQQDAYASLNPAKTISKSLISPLLSRKIAKNYKEAHKMACDALLRVELSPPEMILEKYPHQLSGGQRQRVTIARAILMNPKLIVADEPVSMIDVSLRIAMLNLMARLNKELNIAFIYITHDLATARYMAQNGRIVVMYLGKIVEVGMVRDVLENPRHPYLQALLAAVPVPDPDLQKKRRELPLKSFDMPSIVNPPSGCCFHPRCLFATEECSASVPEMKDLGNGHFCACHHEKEIPEWKYFED